MTDWACHNHHSPSLWDLKSNKRGTLMVLGPALGVLVLVLGLLALLLAQTGRLEQAEARTQAAEFIAWLAVEGQPLRGPARDTAISTGQHVCQALGDDDETARRAVRNVYASQPTNHAANTFLAGAVTYFCPDREARLLDLMRSPT